MTEDYDVDATMRLMRKEIEMLKKQIEISAMPMSVESDASNLEELTDDEVIRRVQLHIEKHKHRSLAPFSIAGMSRLVRLAEVGLRTIQTDITKQSKTNCTGCCYTNGYCNCKGD